MQAVEKTKYYGLVLPNVFPNGASLESIQHVTQTSEGSKDNEFLITLTNGQELPFKIRNGTGIAKVEQTKTSLSPSGMNEITVTDTDSPAHTYKFNVKNGVGITSMKQIVSTREGSQKNVFEFTDSEKQTSTFEVYNGNGIAKMEQTVKSEEGSAVNTFEFTDTDGNTKAFDVYNGNGIASIEKTETDEQSGTNTLTITETNGNTTEWHVKNGTGIAKMEQTVKSETEGDTQVFTFTDSAGKTADFEVKNGIGVEHLAEVDATVAEFKESVNATVTEYTDKMDALTADEETEGSLNNKLKTTREELQKMLDDFKSESAEKIEKMQETIDAIPFTEDGLREAIDTQVGANLLGEVQTLVEKKEYTLTANKWTSTGIMLPKNFNIGLIQVQSISRDNTSNIWNMNMAALVPLQVECDDDDYSIITLPTSKSFHAYNTTGVENLAIGLQLRKKNDTGIYKSGMNLMLKSPFSATLTLTIKLRLLM